MKTIAFRTFCFNMLFTYFGVSYSTVKFQTYCSLFRSLSALDLRKLQCVQNSLARIVTNTTKYSHITPVRKILHWLPIEQRSIFKTALLVYKFLNCGQPRYFAPFLKPRQSVYNTRKSQADGVFLDIPHFATSLF